MNPPKEYLTGLCDFYHLCLDINENVLIPRLETEYLVFLILQKEKGRAKVLDLCAGSGAIGLALKYENPHFDVVLADISPEALEIAKRNAQKHKLEVQICKSDLFTNISKSNFDIIVANPPYVTTAEYEELDPSVKDYEPRKALWGGDDGLLYYREIARASVQFLQKGGRLYLETSPFLIDQLSGIFISPHWRQKRIVQDQFGRDRFFFLEFQP